MEEGRVTGGTELLAADAAGVTRAADLLRAGQLVAFPTETVYGLGADARNCAAVARVYAAKGRPSFNPLIVHVPDLAAAEALGEFPPLARALAARFWPGPLTLVVPVRPGLLPGGVTAGLPSVALRVPAHPLARALLQAFGGPLAGPSANPSGRVSPTSAAHVLSGLSGRIAAVLDGGACPLGLESTIVAVEGEAVTLLRTGGVTEEALREAGFRVAQRAEGGGVTAPGQLESHYAPGAALRLDARGPDPGEAWLGFGPLPAGLTGPALTLSTTGNLDEAAANLFAHLRTLDAALPQGGRIAVARVPRTGIGRAINDRLRRAAAPRPGPVAA